MKILVTSAAGFIGSKVMYELARRGDSVTGIDCINDYYDIRLKFQRLQECGFEKSDAEWDHNISRSSKFDHCEFIRMAIDDQNSMNKLF